MTLCNAAGDIPVPDADVIGISSGTDTDGNGTDTDGNGTDTDGNGTDTDGNSTDTDGNGTDTDGNGTDTDGNGTDTDNDDHRFSDDDTADGHTSTDSISDDKLHHIDWRLRQVRTRTFATNPKVTQYWHWVTENKDKKNPGVIEHQVLKCVRPPEWAVFKKPYNFHLILGDIQEVKFATGRTKVIVSHKNGKDGKDTKHRGDVMARFKRERTKQRFLTFLGKKGVNIVEVGM
jgi:hypothetical protein